LFTGPPDGMPTGVPGTRPSPEPSCMYPVLFHAFGYPVYAYVAATVLSYVLAVVIGWWLARRDGRDWRDLIDGTIVVVLSAVLGAKLFHVLFEAEGHKLPDGSIATGVIDLLKADPWHWARLFEAGYVFYGGLVMATLMGFIFVYRLDEPDKFAAGDYAAPGFMLGIALGRVGCVLAGCCYGHPTDLPWAIHFPEGHPTGGIGVHPVQLYDVGFGVAGLLFCWWYWSRRRFGGELFAILCAAYGVWRFTSEMFRGDADRGLWLGGTVSTSQLVSLSVVPVAGVAWYLLNKHLAGKWPERYGPNRRSGPLSDAFADLEEDSLSGPMPGAMSAAADADDDKPGQSVAAEGAS
jgi:phosphatidylglycerol:prolipoprotein diacylglycerol transferase